jgi:hypothetical protein
LRCGRYRGPLKRLWGHNRTRCHTSPDVFRTDNPLPHGESAAKLLRPAMLSDNEEVGMRGEAVPFDDGGPQGKELFLKLRLQGPGVST